MKYNGEIKIYFSEDKQQYGKVEFTFDFDPNTACHITYGSGADVDAGIKDALYKSVAVILNEMQFQAKNPKVK